MSRNKSVNPVLELSESERVIIVLELTMGVTILILNALIIYAVLAYKRLQTFTNYLIANLAFTDFCTGLNMPLHAMFYAFKSMQANVYVCLLRYTTICCCFSASMQTLILIALDRYLAIAGSVNYVNMTRKIPLPLVMSAIWLEAGLLTFLPPYLGWNNWKLAPVCKMETLLKKEYVYYVLVFQFFILGAVIVLIYVAIVWKLRQKLKAVCPLLDGNMADVRAVALNNQTPQQNCPSTLQSHALGNPQKSASSPQELFLASNTHSRCDQNNLLTVHGSASSNKIAPWTAKMILNNRGESLDNGRKHFSRTSIIPESIEVPLSNIHETLKNNKQTPLATESTAQNNQSNILSDTGHQICPTSRARSMDISQDPSSGRTFLNTTAKRMNDIYVNLFAPSMTSNRTRRMGDRSSQRRNSSAEQETISYQREPHQTINRAILEHLWNKQNKMTLTILGIFFGLWFPFVLITFIELEAGSVPGSTLDVISTFCALLAIINSAVNPLVYMHQGKAIRSVVREIMGSLGEEDLPRRRTFTQDCETLS